MPTLLLYNQQQAIKPISANNESKYNQIASEVENLELGKLLGTAFLQDVQTNPLTAENISLLDGATFTDCYGNSITHKGLRFVLAYMNYSEYLGSSFAVDTFTGFVKKTHENAEPLAEGERKRIMARVREIALQEWELIKTYLNENSNDYPLWDFIKEKKPYSPKITSLRKTKRDYSNDNITRYNY